MTTKHEGSLELDLAVAEARMQQAAHMAEAAAAMATAREAEWLRLLLRQAFEEHPSIESVSWDAEYSSDDEGGYFRVINLVVLTDHNVEESEDADDPEDALMDVQPTLGAIQLVTGGGDDWEGSITRAQLLDDRATS